MGNVHSRSSRSVQGFTLIEISLALMVIGLIMVPLLRIYHIETIQRRIYSTTTNANIITAALGKFVERNGFYPPPAQMNIPLNDPGAGRAVDLATYVPGPCAVGSTTVCVTNSNSADANSDGINDNVLIGTIPYATLGIPFDVVMDGYGYQYTYAVTASLTAVGTFDNARGAIRVQNDRRNPANSLYYPAGSPQAHFVVVSHGEDARGAFNQHGFITQGCGAASNGLDVENCNNDGLFRNNVFQFEDVPDSTPGLEPDNKIQFNRVAGANKFDDVVLSASTTTSGYWSFVPNRSIITTTQNSNLVLGTDATCTNTSCLPRKRMDVNGNALVDMQLKTRRLCTANQADCDSSMSPTLPQNHFAPQVLMGSPVALPIGHPSWNSTRQGHAGGGIRCTDGRAMNGVSLYDEKCLATVRISNPAITGPGCNPVVDGRMPVGLTATGAIICE